MHQLVILKSYPNRLLAEVEKGKLESENIPAMIQADDKGKLMVPFTFNGRGILLLVRNIDLEQAKKMLKI